MKVLLINGSPNPKGNTRRALEEVAATLATYSIDTEIIDLGKHPIPGCIACYKCYETGVCVFNQGVYATIREKLEEGVDGFVFGSPTYYAGPNGSLCSLMDRLFYSLGRYFQNKPAAAVGVCRRAGAVEVVDRINKYFAISNMPIVTSRYWNLAFGRDPDEVEGDAEGLQTIRTLAHNMARMLSALADAPVPEREQKQWTNFIR